MNRWWIYQKERFPIFKNGLLIAIFSSSAVSYSLLVREFSGQSSAEQPWPQLLGLMVLAFLALFLFFLQLRIADEFKDLKEDMLYRPYRPVPRGLVSLSELKLIGLAAAWVQFGLALSIGLPMVLLLLCVWGYLGLMTQEFFAPQWLKDHPVIYLLSHAVIMPLLALYATAHDWLAAGTTPAKTLIWFLLVSFLSGLTIELGRKIRAPKDEETGVATYSTLWGHQSAIIVWLTVVWLMALITLQAGVQINFVVPVTIIVLMLLMGSVIVGWRFWMKPTPTLAKHIELLAGLWTIGIYFNIGILPLWLRHPTP